MLAAMPPVPLDVAAPGRLGVVEAFCNTLDARSFRTFGIAHEPHDELATPDQLATWLRRAGLCRRGLRAGAADLRLAGKLRLLLRDEIRRHDEPLPTTGARRPRRTDVPREILDRLPLRAVVSGGRFELEPVDDGIRGALAAITAIVVTADRDGSWQRMRMCAADDCGWVYFDVSRNRSARWCSMATCGNREKTRRYRHRTT